MLARTLAALALLALAPLAADAAQIVQQVPVPPRAFFTAVSTGGAEQEIEVELPNVFDRFDPALGTLTGIDFAWDYHFRLTLDVASAGGGAGGVTGPFTLEGSTIGGDGNGNGGGGDTPGVQVLEFALTGHQELPPAHIPGAWLLAFLGSPPQDVEIVYEPRIWVRSTGDATVSLEMLDTSSVTLTYEYLPEPDAGLAALVAIVALLARRA